MGAGIEDQYQGEAMRLGKAVQDVSKDEEGEGGPGGAMGQGQPKARIKRDREREVREGGKETEKEEYGERTGIENLDENPAPLAWSGANDDLNNFSNLLSLFKEEIPCPTCKARPCITCGGDGTVIGLVGYLLREARAKLTPKLEQKKMAGLLGISSAYLSVLERGDKRFPEQLAMEYVRVLVENGWKVIQVEKDREEGEEKE